MDKKYLTLVGGIILTLVLAGAGCNSSAATDDAKISTPPQAAPVTFNGQVKEFTVTAKNWQFDPGTMTVNQGDKVRLKITSVDIVHSFMLKDYGLNIKLEPNQTQVIEFIADKAGTFPFRCGVPCGEGHRDMTGTLVVK